MHRFLALSCLVGVLSAESQRLAFSDYPVQSIFRGAPAPPQLTSPVTRRYRTRIRNGAASRGGYNRGSAYVETKGPNYAGHYRVVNWGCGTGCLEMVVVDLETGRVYPPPLSAGRVAEDRLIIPNLGTGWGDFDFRLNSRLFLMRTCPLGFP